MRQPLFPKSSVVNLDRINRIERIVTRFARRSNKLTSALITPYPISSATFGEDVRGSILRYMFPCEGVIAKGLIKLGSRPKGGAEVNVELSNNAYSDSRGFIITSRQLIVEPDLNVASGDCLDISIRPVDESDKLNEVWVSFLWVPTIKDADIKHFLIEELDKLEESTIEELVEE